MARELQFRSHAYRLQTETPGLGFRMGPSDGLIIPGEWKADLSDYPIVSRLPRLIQTQGFPGMRSTAASS